MIELSRTSAAILMVSFAFFMWGLMRRSEQRHLQRIADLKERTRQLKIHAAALRSLLAQDAAPTALQELVRHLSADFEDERIIRRLLNWLRDAEAAATAAANLPVVLERFGVSDATTVTQFEQCIDSGFMAGVLKEPDTAELRRQVSTRFVTRPHRELAVAMQIWPEGANGFQPPSAAFA